MQALLTDNFSCVSTYDVVCVVF